jgi:hypothetical protein
LVIWQCLQELHRRKIHGAIDNVVLMGAPVPSDNLELWKNAKEVVAGRLVNCYTKDDWVLGRLQKEKEVFGE